MQQLLHPLVVLALLVSLIAPVLPYWLPLQTVSTVTSSTHHPAAATPPFAAPQGIHAAERLHALTTHWKMPDIDIGAPMGTVIVNAAGSLQVFSVDHLVFCKISFNSHCVIPT